jgi:pyruvate,orthophosphate dikinase
MQARAIFEAALIAGAETGEHVVPEIMIPLVAMRVEFEKLKEVVDRVARAVAAEKNERLDYLVGTMIELPRAALRAGAIAQTAEFFSFGTNDLTQTTFGISRDDSAKFLADYREKGLIENDPFVTLDTEGVGELVRIAAQRGRQARPDLKLGICGEHGGDPASIRFCGEIGLDYVSCSPYRVPIARLAAGQAAIARSDHREDR